MYASLPLSPRFALSKVSAELTKGASMSRNAKEGTKKQFLCDIVKVKNVRFYFYCPGGFMIKILFVCHGNICRSPMAEFVMKDIIAKAGRGDDFSVSSAGYFRGNHRKGPIP